MWICMKNEVALFITDTFNEWCKPLSWTKVYTVLTSKEKQTSIFPSISCVCHFWKHLNEFANYYYPPPPPTPPFLFLGGGGGGGQGGGQVCSVNHAITGKGLTFLPSLPVLIFLLLNYVNVNFVLYTVLLEITGVGAITISITQPTNLRWFQTA